MKQCYIWTVLTQHIKPVEGGLSSHSDRDPCCWTSSAAVLMLMITGRAPPNMAHTGCVVEGGGGAAVYFGAMPGRIQTNSEDESIIKMYFYFHG